MMIAKTAQPSISDEIPSQSLDQQEPTALMTEAEAAKLLRVSIGLLRKWRSTGEGPKFIKLIKLVRYEMSDLQEFVKSHRIGGHQQ